MARIRNNNSEYPSIEDLYEANDGKIVKIHGISHRIKFTTHSAIYPYKHLVVDVDLIPVNKRSEYYLKTKRELHDDWVVDGMKLEGETWLEVYNQLLTKSKGRTNGLIPVSKSPATKRNKTFGRGYKAPQKRSKPVKFGGKRKINPRK